MKDIYSPLEIDEEWDNYSPVDATATAPASTEAPAMAVPVTTSESGAQDMNLGTEDPARDAANAEIAQEQGSTAAAPSVEENINKWTANDGNINTENSDKLEFGEMGSKLPAEKADSVDDAVNTAPVKIDVNPSVADTDMNSMNAEVDNSNDMPKPVEISMSGSDDGESTYSAESNASDMPKPDAEELGSGSIAPLPIMPTAPAAENTNTPDSKEDTPTINETNELAEPEVAAPENNSSNIDQAKAAYISTLEEGISDEEANYERMKADLEKAEAEAEALREGMKNSQNLIDKLKADKAIVSTESSK